MIKGTIFGQLYSLHRWTKKDILGDKLMTSVMRRETPEVNRGFSERYIRLFCLKNGIKKLGNFQADNIIQQSISEVSGAKRRSNFIRVL